MPALPPSPHWPAQLPRQLTLPATHLFFNVEVAAARYPDKPFLIFYDSRLSYAAFQAEAEALAGYLQQHCGVRRGDRVLLDLQNSPQWVLAYYAILRADAVVVPINPMNRSEELRHLLLDSGARVGFVAQDLLTFFAPLADEACALQHTIVVTYADHLRSPTDLAVPDFVRAPREVSTLPGAVGWADAVAACCRPAPYQGGPDDIAVMPYTSGTTGQPKGCVHTHRSVMSTAVGGIQWFGRTQDAVSLCVLPLFHVTGMSGSMNGPLFAGATIVLLPRWDRDAAATCMQRYRVTTWQAITTMVVDFLANPRLDDHDLSSLAGIRGGGAAMPAAVAHRLKARTGLDFVEGYGLTETLAATHLNPVHRPKPQCLGLPVFDVDARVIDPATLAELPPGETGEIVVHGPQIMQGYWQRPEADRDAFLTIDGLRFLRTGDLGHVDPEGYFFMTDRLKRMINASGYKVWPAEVEALMYQHPGVLEACVIGARDAHRGETVKALVVRRADEAGAALSEAVLRDWCHAQMAAYKRPRIIEFVDQLPKSGSGKVMWRWLQAEQDARDTAPPQVD